jgi:hypothetical protein
MDVVDPPTVIQPKPLSEHWGELVKPKETGGVGEPIFTKMDVFTVNQSLAQLLRFILIMHNVTWQELQDKTSWYAYHLNLTSRDTGILRGNLKKEIQKPKISYSKFEQILSNVLGYSIEDLSVTLKDKSTGQIYQHSISEIDSLLIEEKIILQ